MRRLVQARETIDPAETRLVELVQATAKTSVNPFRKRAILHRLETGTRPTPLLRPWAGGVAGVLLVGTATAGSITWWRDRHPAPLAAVVPAAPAPEPLASTPSLPSAEPLAETSPVAIHELASVASGDAAPTGFVRSGAAAHPRARTALSDDPTAVMQAIRALRTDHDPWRAEDLLQSYLHAHPRGAIAEEALALQIEAARARHDVIALERASRYLRLYPNGAYRKAAETALQSPR